MLLQTIPTLQTPNVSTFVESIILASMKGVKIYVTKATVEKFHDIFEKLGITVREVESLDPQAEYIMIKVVGVKVEVEIHDANKIITRTFNTKAFVKAFEDYIAKRRGNVSVSPLYELNIPNDIIEKLKETGGNED